VTVATSDATFLARADGKSDFNSIHQQLGCARSTHSDWITNGKKALADPRVAGPLPEVRRACEAHSSASTGDDCPCFGVGYDMQASPARRRQFLDAETPLKGLQATLADRDFAMRVAYKCPTTPNFFRPELMVQIPPHASQSDDEHRLVDGLYGINALNVTYDPGNHGTYTITRTGNWRYEFRWQKGPIVSRDPVGYLSADGKQVTVYSGEPQPRTFQVVDKGILQGQVSGYQVELVHVSILTRRRDPRSPSQSGRERDATPQQCERLKMDIERFRGDPRRTRTLAILEKRYADWCAAR
jgi:hypothetical protein